MEAQTGKMGKSVPMMRFARLLLYACTALLMCFLWSDAPARTTHWWSLVMPAEYKVREVAIDAGPDIASAAPKTTSSESTSDQEHQQTQEWEAKQQRRQVALKLACRQWLPKARDYLPKNHNDMNHFLVDDLHKALYCYVPKVSCTTWKRIWMILTGMTTETDPLAISLGLPHAIHHRMMLVKQPNNASVMQSKLDSYRKFLVVRNPYERLLSAYRNKLEHPKTAWKKFADVINKKHGMGNNTELTFSAFVNYVINLPKTNFDEHWRTYHRLCYPCAIKFDIIAKYETLFEDSERYLQLIGAPDDLHFPPYVPSKTTSLLPHYMANLSQAQRHSLYQVYRRDFEAFQYEPFGGSD